eukprot:scaffold35542_cov51-Phaeocystis_antarctica.AAC.1
MSAASKEGSSNIPPCDFDGASCDFDGAIVVTSTALVVTSTSRQHGSTLLLTRGNQQRRTPRPGAAPSGTGTRVLSHLRETKSSNLEGCDKAQELAHGPRARVFGFSRLSVVEVVEPGHGVPTSDRSARKCHLVANQARSAAEVLQKCCRSTAEVPTSRAPSAEERVVDCVERAPLLGVITR